MSRALSFKSKLCKEKLCFSFSLCKPNELTLAFVTRSFQKSSFCFLDEVYLAQIFQKKGACFFSFGKNRRFCRVIEYPLAQVRFCPQCPVSGVLEKSHRSLSERTSDTRSDTGSDTGQDTKWDTGLETVNTVSFRSDGDKIFKYRRHYLYML